MTDYLSKMFGSTIFSEGGHLFNEVRDFRYNFQFVERVFLPLHL